MERRRRFLLIAASAAGLALVAWLVIPPVGVFLAAGALERAASAGTGLPCRVGSVRRAGKGLAVEALELGVAGTAPYFRVSAAEVEFFDRRRLGAVRLDGADLDVLLPGQPMVQLKGVRLSAERLELLAKPENAAEVTAQGNCRDLNPLLKENGGVRFERGTFVLKSRPDLSGEVLDVPVTVTLRDIKVRSLDGRFEVEAAEAEATVRITGTLEDPRLDLGELEPWLGEGFARGSGKTGKTGK